MPCPKCRGVKISTERRPNGNNICGSCGHTWPNGPAAPVYVSESKVRLTQEDINEAIVSEEYIKMGKKTVVCLLTLKNGFEIVGTGSCVDPANFDMAIGKTYAREDAANQIWKLEGYHLQCQHPASR